MYDSKGTDLGRVCVSAIISLKKAKRGLFLRQHCYFNDDVRPLLHCAVLLLFFIVFWCGRVQCATAHHGPLACFFLTRCLVEAHSVFEDYRTALHAVARYDTSDCLREIVLDV